MIIPASRIAIPEEDHKEVFSMLKGSFESGILTNGPLCREFESLFKEIVNREYAICTSTGTSALEVAFKIINVKDLEVIVPTNTNFATPAAVLNAGGIVKFADCDKQTLSPTLDEIKGLVTHKTKAIVLVHIGGIITPEIEAIREYCDETHITLVEDAAHAHGSKYKGKPAGSFGDIACFSFYPTKVMTCGEGGIIVTDQSYVYKEAHKYIEQGKDTPDFNYHTRMGSSWRMTELHAALGITQVKRLYEFIEARKGIADIYDKKLRDSRLKPHPIPENVDCNYYKYIIDLEPKIDRERLRQVLKEKGVSLSGGVYDIPCHLQPVFSDIPAGSLEDAEYFCQNHICLPIYPSMSSEEACFIADKLEEAIKEL